jgi:tagatose-1,6-bisphosphate aldolase
MAKRPKSLLLETPSLEQLESQLAALAVAQREELIALMTRHQGEMETLMRKIQLCKKHSSLG